MLSLAVSAQAAPAFPTDVSGVIETAKQQIQKTDFRASGHLIRVEATGVRTSYGITIKAHWFPGVLKVLLDISPPPDRGPSSGPNARSHVLLQVRPDGRNSIQVARRGDKEPSSLPFDKWSEGPLGIGFSYEDFMEQQYFWQGQAPLEETTFAARDCFLLKSMPSAADRTHYSEVKTWLDRSISFPVYVEKSLKGTETVKEFTYSGLRHEGGIWSAHQIEEKTRGQAGATLLIIDRGTAKANLGLGDFSPEQLIRF
jgi:hypothetical protein